MRMLKIAALWIVLGVSVLAQSYQVTLPASSPLRASYAFASVSTPVSLVAVGGQIQHITQAMSTVQTTTTVSYVVTNSTYAGLFLQGTGLNGVIGGCAPVSACVGALITATRPDGTHLSVTVTRDTVNANATTVAFDIIDLNSAFIQAIYFGTANLATPFTYTACNGGLAKTLTMMIGGQGGNSNSRLVVTNGSISIQNDNTNSGSYPSTTGIEVICLY